MKGPEAQFLRLEGESNRDKNNMSEDFLLLQKNRALSDAELLKGGAEYEYDKNGNIILNPTKDQKDDIKKFFENERNENFKESTFEKSESEKIQKRLLDILIERDCLKRENSFLVIDLRKFNSDEFFEEIRQLVISNDGDKKIKANRHNIFRILGDLRVVSMDDFENSAVGNIEPKALFNVPENIDEAFDQEKIRENQYYLNYWDIYKKSGAFRNGAFETKSGELLDAKEYYLATKIYRDFKGKRDEKGDLLVYDFQKGAYVKITRNWVRKNIGKFGDSEGLHTFIQKHGKNLLSKNLITNEDLPAQSVGKTSEFKRPEYRYNGAKLQPMINNVIYFVGDDNFVFRGEKIPLENVIITQLDQNIGGVVFDFEGEKVLKYTFPLLSEEEIEQKRKKVSENDSDLSDKKNNKICRVGKSELEMRLREWNIYSDNPKVAGESTDLYHKRMANLKSFSFVSSRTAKFINQSGVSIHQELSWREQQWLAVSSYEFGLKGEFDKLCNFGRKYQKNGLRSFLSLEHGGQEMGQKILDIGEKYDQVTADKIFAKYAELADYAQNSARYLAKEFNIKDETKAQEIAEHLLRRGKALLAVCAEEDLTFEQINQKLENIRGEVEMLSGTLKLAKESGSNINPEVIKGLRIEKRVGSLSEKEKKEVIKIFEDNYKEIFADNPQAFQRVKSDFLKEIGSLEDQQVYIMKFNNELIAFCRFKPLTKNKVYGGSLNVIKEIQGMAIGGYFINTTLKEVSENYDIVIKTRKDNPANNKYQKEGFVVTGEHREPDGVDYYEMILPQKNSLKKAA